jgi:hypothetical protein
VVDGGGLTVGLRRGDGEDGEREGRIWGENGTHSGEYGYSRIEDVSGLSKSDICFFSNICFFFSFFK